MASRIHIFGASGAGTTTLHEEFMAWARSYDEGRVPIRSLHMQQRWRRRLSCPVLSLDSSCSTDALCAQVLEFQDGRVR